MRCYVLMGVSGCGKSSVGVELSVLCGMDFVDGDGLHPPANIAKMSRGEPLDDTDRAPWLEQVGRVLANSTGPIVIACSALKKSYRDIIRAQVPEPVHFLHLDAPIDVLAQRVTMRAGHFMPTALLDSQFDALEQLGPDECGSRVDVAQPLAQVIAQTGTYVKETMN